MVTLYDEIRIFLSPQIPRRHTHTQAQVQIHLFDQESIEEVGFQRRTL